jgi:16S rRNA (uracil1498-N3)-methyltransferase
MSQRLYLPPPLLEAAEHTLNAEDSHYLVRVLRLKSGAELRCFDGEGGEWAARLGQASTRGCVLVIGKLLRREARPEAQLHLAQGWLKGQAMDQIVQKATELGVSHVWPITATRSNVKLDDARTDNRMRHWQRIARSASEQSERLYLPELHRPGSLAEFLEHTPCATQILLQPGCAPLPTDLVQQSLAILVGPEGGWTAAEVDAAKQHGVLLHGLGKLILRAETVPLAALAAVRHGWAWD